MDQSERDRTIQKRLLREFDTKLGWATEGNNLSSRRVSSLYELYVLKIILEIAEVERRARIDFVERNIVHLQPPAMKTGPHRIHDESYTYARIKFRNRRKQILEAHTGLKFRGKSGILTECDVAVLGINEANRSRECRIPNARDCTGNSCCDPRDHRLILSVECKCYTRNITLEMAREFVGLSADLAVPYGNVFYVVSYPIVPNGRELLNRHREDNYFPEMTPALAPNVEALKERVRDVFDKHEFF